MSKIVCLRSWTSSMDARMRPGPLQPYDPAEAISTAEAARRAGKCERTMREWCFVRSIGRKIGGRWMISAPALDMLLAGDLEALDAYLAGDRLSLRVRAYFERRGVPLSAVAVHDTSAVAALNDAIH